MTVVKGDCRTKTPQPDRKTIPCLIEIRHRDFDYKQHHSFITVSIQSTPVSFNVSSSWDFFLIFTGFSQVHRFVLVIGYGANSLIQVRRARFNFLKTETIEVKNSKIQIHPSFSFHLIRTWFSLSRILDFCTC